MKHKPVGALDLRLVEAEHFLGEAQVFELHVEATAIDQPQDHLLAVHAGQGADANVEARAARNVLGGVDSTVEGRALVVDIELRHDLQAREDLLVSRDGVDALKHSVEAHAHPHLVALLWLKMQIAGPRLEGIGNPCVDLAFDVQSSLLVTSRD